MANVLSKEKQVMIIAALAEGSSLRALTSVTGIHRTTNANLALRVGEGCARLLDAKMRDLTCNYLQFDEIWGFIGKKEKHVSFMDDPTKVTFGRSARLTRKLRLSLRTELASALT